MKPAFHDQFVELFKQHFDGLYRYLDRLTGEPDLAADLAQETFVRLYRRGSPPDTLRPWLVAVSMNLLRNARSARSRRIRLLTPERSNDLLSDPPPSPAETLDAVEARQRVRRAIDRLPERERRMLLLRAEGHSYRDIGIALELNEASIGTLLARAKKAFREVYEETSDAS